MQSIVFFFSHCFHNWNRYLLYNFSIFNSNAPFILFYFLHVAYVNEQKENKQPNDSVHWDRLIDTTFDRWIVAKRKKTIIVEHASSNVCFWHFNCNTQHFKSNDYNATFATLPDIKMLTYRCDMEQTLIFFLFENILISIWI